MEAGPYRASFAISSRYSSVSVRVTLTTSTSPTLVVTLTSLAFGFQHGGSSPAAPNASVTSSSGSAISFTDAKSSASWLSATRTSGTTPSSIGVSVNPASLAVGTCNASVRVTSNAASATVPVRLTVTSSTSGGGTGTGASCWHGANWACTAWTAR